jgi:hypothetical protein
MSSTVKPRARTQPEKWVAYGAGNALLGLRAVTSLPIAYVVDDTPGFAGGELDGLEIHASSRLGKENPDNLMILVCANTTMGILGISRRLLGLGFKPGIHFIDCSRLQAAPMARRLQEDLGIRADLDRMNAVRSLALALRPRNLSTIAGSWLFLELLQSLPRSAVGAVAECGVYQGANALIASILSAPLAEREYDLYDSFEGLTEFSAADPSSRRSEFSDVNLNEVELLFANVNNVRIIKGRFDQTMPLQSPRPHSLVYVDCDLKEPTLYCCRHFWPQIVPGGYLMTHDYWFPAAKLPAGAKPPFSGVREAFDQFCDEEGLRPVVFPETSHAVLKKL